MLKTINSRLATSKDSRSVKNDNDQIIKLKEECNNKVKTLDTRIESLLETLNEKGR